MKRFIASVPLGFALAFLAQGFSEAAWCPAFLRGVLSPGTAAGLPFARPTYPGEPWIDGMVRMGSIALTVDWVYYTMVVFGLWCCWNGLRPSTR